MCSLTLQCDAHRGAWLGGMMHSAHGKAWLRCGMHTVELDSTVWYKPRSLTTWCDAHCDFDKFGSLYSVVGCSPRSLILRSLTPQCASHCGAQSPSWIYFANSQLKNIFVAEVLNKKYVFQKSYLGVPYTKVWYTNKFGCMLHKFGYAFHNPHI